MSLHGRRYPRFFLRKPMTRRQQVVEPDIGPGIAGTGRGPGRGRVVFTPPSTGPRRRRWMHPLNYTPVQNYFRRHTRGY